MRYFFLYFIIFFSFVSFSQKQKPKNYSKFDDKWIHFGVMFGGNTADFYTLPEYQSYEKYGLLALEHLRQPGGQIGMLTTVKLGTPLVRVRFIPSISFQERALNYYYPPQIEGEKEVVDLQRVNSTNLDFPLMLQFRTERYNNFAAYCLGGIQYTYDLQTKEDANQDLNDPFVKIRASDWQGQVGCGVEFFAVFFKMSLEIKYSHGFFNQIIKDNTPLSNPIDQLKNRVWHFSIIFEG